MKILGQNAREIKNRRDDSEGLELDIERIGLNLTSDKTIF